ncbi:MAG: hypothetical protein M1819_006251 [Sarea resinae]|nr:MAG: hypothetical protein M1819_006251 [Sarea resinae]
MASPFLIRLRVVYITCSLLFFLCVDAQGNASDTGFYGIPEAFRQAFPEFNSFPPRPSSIIGGQQFDTRCCMIAVNESLYSDANGTVQVGRDRYLMLSNGRDVNSSMLERNWPCNSQYTTDPSGNPIEVNVNYTWCHQKCPGWQRSGSKNLSQWVQPLVGFLLPSVVFVLAIPRQRKIEIPEELFKIEKGNLLVDIVVGFYYASIAGSIAVLDTVVWLSIVFAYAGPMLISALYEAGLDRQILEDDLRKSPKTKRKGEVDQIIFMKDGQVQQKGLRAIHLLYAILVGNLEFGRPRIGRQQDGPILLDDMSSNGEGTPSHEPCETEGAWNHIRYLVGRLSAFEKEHDTRLELEKTKVRLRTMLACQYSFGSMVGAPVIFYVGSFVLTLADVFSDYGDNDTSHALAFGIWWMTVAHITVVGGCLLAGNNPNTLEGVMVALVKDAKSQLKEGEEEQPAGWKETFLRGWRWLRVGSYFYNSVYKPADLWDRAELKDKWIREVRKVYTFYEGDNSLHEMDLGEWSIELSIAVILLSLPCLLGLFVAYYTPAIGLSCRSLTFLVYYCTQLALLCCWLWKFLDKNLAHRRLRWCVWKVIDYSVFAISVFCVLGGTLMQIIGVYRNCLCQIPVWYWLHLNNDFRFPISTNNYMAIRDAKKYWKSFGITAAVFLLFVTYVGWWYQRHMKWVFRDIVERLGDTDTRATDPHDGSAPRPPPIIVQEHDSSSTGAPVGVRNGHGAQPTMHGALPGENASSSSAQPAEPSSGLSSRPSDGSRVSFLSTAAAATATPGPASRSSSFLPYRLNELFAPEPLFPPAADREGPRLFPDDASSSAPVSDSDTTGPDRRMPRASSDRLLP